MQQIRLEVSDNRDNRQPGARLKNIRIHEYMCVGLRFRPAQPGHENENETDTHVSFCKKSTARPNLFTKTKTKQTHNMQNSAGYSNFATIQTTISNHALSSITHHVSKEEGRTASRRTPKKELRRTIAINIYCDIICKKDSMKEADQTKLMETLFFGNGGPDAISYIDMF
mmetsp:Transcript_21880/g.28196  ORF Transcript_21880/g.28196 Transcript_21880/m.28196 type:complete len:170 (-) Transcript_21880:118-627(-)